MKLKFYLITIFLILLLSCSSDENIIQTEPLSQKKDVPSIDYTQLQSWRSELRTEILESRRRLNLSNDLTLRSQIFVNETLDFYVWIKNNLSEDYVDKSCDDDLFKKTIRSQLSPVELLIQISPPTDDPFELFPLPSEIIHILGSEGSVGLEKDTFNLIDPNTLEWSIEFGSEPLRLEKKDVWYIVPTRLTEQIFKGCKK
tara:strand:- start:281 stop:880 length:600 start_codon:yes stop_codon:yes gene_type:complete